MAREVKKKKNGKGTGRHLIDVDWEEVAELCKIQCTQEEIAAVTNITVDTLDAASKRENDCSFSEFYRQKKLGGNTSLRRKQWALASAENATMQIWLGKQYLGQTDKQEISEKDPKPVHIEIIYPS